MAPDEVIQHDQHTNKKGPSVYFFKIMFGFDFHRVMYLPPQFAQTVNHLAGQETEIEDSCGERWTVKLSYVDDCLSFRKGWKKFSRDHNLEEGQFLVFKYRVGGHFSVRIFRSSACEITIFNYVRPRPNRSSSRRKHNHLGGGGAAAFQNGETQPDLTNNVDTAAAGSSQQQLLHTKSTAGMVVDPVQTADIKIELETISPSSEDPIPMNVDDGSKQSDKLATGMEDDPICLKPRDDDQYEGEIRIFGSGFSDFEMENGSGKDLKGPEFAAILHPEITEDYANNTGKDLEANNASYARVGIAGEQQTKTRQYAAYDIDSDSGSIEKTKTRRHHTKNVEVCDIDSDGMDQQQLPPRASMCRSKGVVVGSDSDTDRAEQFKVVRRLHTKKGVVCDSDSDGVGMEQLKGRRRGKKKVLVCDSDSHDSDIGLNQSKTVGKKHKKEGGVGCGSGSDGMEQLLLIKKRSSGGDKKDVAYDYSAGCDGIGMEQQQYKTRGRHTAKKGLTLTCDSDAQKSETRRIHAKKKGLACSRRDSKNDGGIAAAAAAAIEQQPKIKKRRLNSL